MIINRKLIWLTIGLAIFINGLGIFEPLLRNDDPLLYANIAKHMVLTNNWIDLFSAGQPWLDKPHFPFWITALSFKIFGINSFAYFLPGFFFHLLGAVYTYRLAKLIYSSDEVALIALLIYVTSIHLLLSASIDVRAEAYLLGQIMPACYYWLRYDYKCDVKSLILASLFTGLAMMTKGIFVVVTIFSGLVITWLYRKQYTRIISRQWLIAYVLSLVFILPELICLYLQFDAHPNAVVFGRTHVSGLEWYFWGSQFGRFFNSGPIVNNHGNPFFFVHTFLWAFLPWSLVFIAATYQSIRHFRTDSTVNKSKTVYLWASFWLTFIMFSATKFQLDHYTNIIMPFAAIICANYLSKILKLSTIAKVQFGLSVLILILAIGANLYLFHFAWLMLYAIIPAVLIIVFFRVKSLSYLERAIVFPSIAISIFFAFALIVNLAICRTYDVGYNLAKFLNKQVAAPVFDLNSGWSALEFYSQNQYTAVHDKAELPKSGDYYLVMKNSALNDNQYSLDNSQYTPKTTFCGNTIDRVIPYYATPAKLQEHLECFVVLQHKG